MNWFSVFKCIFCSRSKCPQQCLYLLKLTLWTAMLRKPSSSIPPRPSTMPVALLERNAPRLADNVSVLPYFHKKLESMLFFPLDNEYGLFLTDEDSKTGVWLEPARSLEYYLLRNGDTIEYRKKTRNLRVKMLDGKCLTPKARNIEINF